MKRLCFGSFFKVIFQASNTTKANVYGYIESIIGPVTNVNKSSLSLREKGDEEFPDYVRDDFLSKDIGELSLGFKKHVINHFHNGKQNQVALALIEIIREDSFIDLDTVVGRKKEYTKRNIINGDKFYLPDLLANVFVYAINVKNSDCKEGIKEIGTNYVESFDSRINEIKLYDVPVSEAVPVGLTLNKKNFDELFVEIDTANIGSSNPSFMKFYTLKLMGKEFDDGKLGPFIRNNLARYVYSREEYKRIKEESDTISLDALTKFQSMYPKEKRQENFGEIMVYSFLEGILNAPKIMSSIEIAEASSYKKIYSRGIHLFKNSGLENSFELVFGASAVGNDLAGTIGNAIIETGRISDNLNNEKSLISTKIISSSFSKEQAQYLKNILLPSEAKKTPYIGASIGIFISYSLEMPARSGVSSFAYQDLVMNQLSVDIVKAAKELHDMFDLHGFDDKFTFYVYVLPLENVEKTVESAFKKAAFTGENNDE